MNHQVKVSLERKSSQRFPQELFRRRRQVCYLAICYLEHWIAITSIKSIDTRSCQSRNCSCEQATEIQIPFILDSEDEDGDAQLDLSKDSTTDPDFDREDDGAQSEVPTINFRTTKPYALDVTTKEDAMKSPLFYQSEIPTPLPQVNKSLGSSFLSFQATLWAMQLLRMATISPMKTRNQMFPIRRSVLMLYQANRSDLVSSTDSALEDVHANLT